MRTTKDKEDIMKKIWNKMDTSTKLAIGCFMLYMALYVLLDIMEELLGVAL